MFAQLNWIMQVSQLMCLLRRICGQKVRGWGSFLTYLSMWWVLQGPICRHGKISRWRWEYTQENEQQGVQSLVWIFPRTASPNFLVSMRPCLVTPLYCTAQRNLYVPKSSFAGDNSEDPRDEDAHPDFYGPLRPKTTQQSRNVQRPKRKAKPKARKAPAASAETLVISDEDDDNMDMDVSKNIDSGISSQPDRTNARSLCLASFVWLRFLLSF